MFLFCVLPPNVPLGWLAVLRGGECKCWGLSGDPHDQMCPDHRSTKITRWVSKSLNSVCEIKFLNSQCAQISCIPLFVPLEVLLFWGLNALALYSNWPGFKFHLCHTPGVWLWASHFPPHSLNFLIYKTRIIIVLRSESYFKDSGTSVCKICSMVPET